MQVSVDLMRTIVNYIQVKPFNEVAHIMVRIQSEYDADQKAAAEAVELSARMKEAKNGVVVVESDAKPV